MVLGAAGAIVPYFFLHWSETIAGFGAFGLAAVGLLLGSLFGKAEKSRGAEVTVGGKAR